jgi:hypothetical protein
VHTNQNDLSVTLSKTKPETEFAGFCEIESIFFFLFRLGTVLFVLFVVVQAAFCIVQKNEPFVGKELNLFPIECELCNHGGQTRGKRSCHEIETLVIRSSPTVRAPKKAAENGISLQTGAMSHLTIIADRC